MKQKIIITMIIVMALALFAGCNEYNKQVGEYIELSDLSNGEVEGWFTFDESNLNEYNHYYIISHFEEDENRVQLYVKKNLTNDEIYLYVGMGQTHYINKIKISSEEKYYFKFNWFNSEEHGIYNLVLNDATYPGFYKPIEEKESYIQVGRNGFTPDIQNKNPEKLEEWSGKLNIK